MDSWMKEDVITKLARGLATVEGGGARLNGWEVGRRGKRLGRRGGESGFREQADFGRKLGCGDGSPQERVGSVLGLIWGLGQEGIENHPEFSPGSSETTHFGSSGWHNISQPH